MSTQRFTVVIPGSPSSEQLSHTGKCPSHSLNFMPFLCPAWNQIRSRAVPRVFVPCALHHDPLHLSLRQKAKLIEQTCIMRRQANRQGKEAYT